MPKGMSREKKVSRLLLEEENPPRVDLFSGALGAGSILVSCLV